MAERPNFYRLLDLDPAIDDWPTIEQRLVEKKRDWARDRTMGSPKQRRRADLAMAALGELEAVLRSPETRRAEAAAARRELESERRARLVDLDEALKLLHTGGAAGDEPLKVLIRQFAGVFDEVEIHARATALGIVLGGAPGPQRGDRPPREVLDGGTAKRIAEELEILGLEDLYAFLGVGKSSSPKALQDRADEIYAVILKAGGTGAESSAKNALAGFAKRIFQNEAEKAKYDAHLAQATLRGLDGQLEIAGGDGFLLREEIDHLLVLARKRGVPTEEALAYFEDYASRKKWRLQRGGAELPAERLRQCGFCFELAAAEATKCSRCGRPLVFDCPRCRTTNPSTNEACVSCGCRLGDAPVVEGLLAEGERLAIRGDFAGALAQIDQALVYWPGWTRATEARHRIDELRKRRELELEAIEKAVREHRLVAALAALERAGRTYGSGGLEARLARVRIGLAEAEKSYQRGEEQRRRGETGEALAAFEAALALAVDYEPARRALAANPPPPPADLVVAPTAAGFHLSWRAPLPGRSLTYRVRRKMGGRPANDQDGEAVAETAAQELDDPAAPVGAVFWYAVFSCRGGIGGPLPATAGPCLRTAEVDRLEVLTAQGEVTLNWSPPPGCLRVEILRGLAREPAESVTLPVAGASVRDTAIVDGTPYRYRVVAVFPDPARPGREVRTPGLTRAVTPTAPPPPVMDLRASREGPSVRLEWTAVPRAAVEIRQAVRPPIAPPGAVLPQANLESLGERVPNASVSSALATMATAGRRFFVPVSLAGGVAVVGAAVEVVAIEPVTGLRVQRSAAGLFLIWQWPAGVTEVVVVWDSRAFPQTAEAGGGQRRTVTKTEYDRQGGWALARAERCPHYFSVFAKAAGSELYGPPAQVVETMGQGLVVSYRVTTKKSLLRRAVEGAQLELSASRPQDIVLPALVVVGKVQGVPISIGDGRVWLECPEFSLPRGRGTLPLPADAWASRHYVKIFFKDHQIAREIRLLPAEGDAIRIV